MKIGVHLPNAGIPDPKGLLDVALEVERFGFDGVWMFDHLLTPVDLASQYPYSRSYALSASDPFFDAVAMMGVLAGAIERIEMGVAVLIPTYRHPIVLAKLLATVDSFAPGRILLGVGAGWMREEFEALDVPFERRGARLDEYMRALRTIWGSDTSSFSGEFYSWQEAGFLPRPAAPIPLIVGGHSDAALRRAARLGDGWAVVTTHEQGRGLDAATRRIGELHSMLDQQGRARDGFLLLFEHALLFGDAPNAKLPFSGPPEAIAESLTRLEDLGVTHVDLMILGMPAQIVEAAQRFVEEVRPLL